MHRLSRQSPKPVKTPLPDRRRCLSNISTVLFALALSGCVTTAVTDTENPSDDPDRVPRNRLQQAVQEYCHEDARETAQYLLTQGTPDDVDLMEQAVVMLDTGEWLVIAEIVRPSQRLPSSSRANDDESAWKVAASCSWKTPFPDLDGLYEFELEVVLSADGSRRVFRLPTTNQ